MSHDRALGDGRRIDFAVAAALVVATLIVFWPVRHFEWIDFDDFQYVIANPRVTGGLSTANFKWAFSSDTFFYWQPLTWLSYQADVWAWGPRPGPIHLENAAIHAASAGLWYLLWARTTGRRLPALWVAALFAFHPTRVESVAWVAERKDVLSTVLLAGSFLAYAGYTRRVGSGGVSKGVYFFLACFAYVLAVMAKPMVVTAPVLLLLLDAWPLCRFRWTGPDRPGTDLVGTARRETPGGPQVRISIARALLEKIPFAVPAAIAAGLTLKSRGQATAVPSLAQLSLTDRLNTATAGYFRYLGNLIAPTRLSIFYPYRYDQPSAVWVSAGSLLAILTWAAWRVRVRRPYVIVGWAWFLVSLLPVIGFVQSGRQSMADRFAYVAAIGPFVIVAWFGADLLYAALVRWGRWTRVAATATAAAATTFYAVVTIRYLPAWHDSISIFTYSANSIGSPNFTIEAHLGDGYVNAGRPDLALPHLAAAVDLSPTNADARVDLATILLRADPADALTHLRAARQFRPDDPFLEYQIGLAYTATRRPDEAASAYRRAIELRPDFQAAREALLKIDRP